jgi:hypothetical protein
VRDVLDEVVRQGKGALLWSVQYADPDGGRARLQVGIDNLAGPGSITVGRGPGLVEHGPAARPAPAIHH